MREVQQVGPLEAGVMLLGFLMGSSLFLPVGIQARQDAWMGVLLGGMAGLIMLWVKTTLGLRFPNQTVIGYSKQLLGRPLGWLVGLVYVWYAFHIGSLVLRTFGEFLLTTVLVGTPLSVPITALMLVAAYTVRHGLETLGRSSLFLVAVILLQEILTQAMVVKQAEPEWLLPMFENGLGPVLAGGFSVFGLPFGESAIFLLLFPHVQPKSKLKRALFAGKAVAILILTITILRNLMVLGPHLVATERFPSLGAVQEINLGDFLTRLDAVIVTNWVATGFIKVAVCHWVATMGTAELLGVKDHRPLVLPIGAAMVAMSIIAFDNVTEMTQFLITVWPFYSLPFQVAIPLLLLAIAWLRGLGAKQTQ